MAATDGRSTVPSDDCCQTQGQLVCEANPLPSIYRPINASEVYTTLAGESATTAVPEGVVIPSIGRSIDTSTVYITNPAGESATMAVPGEVAGVAVGGGAPCSCARVPEAVCSRAVCNERASSVHVSHACKPSSQVAGTEAVDAVRSPQEAAEEPTDSDQNREALVQEVEAAKRNACASIQKAFDELHRVMEVRRRELMEGVEGISDAKKAALAHRNEELRMLRSEMTEYCEVATHTLDTHHEEEEVAPLWELLAAEMRSVQDRMEALPPLLVTPDITTAIVDPSHVAKQISKLGAIN